MGDLSNRYLNFAVNSRGGSSSGMQVAMLVVAILACLAAGASAMFIGRPFIASVLSTPERSAQIDEGFAKQRETVEMLQKQLNDVYAQLSKLQHEQERANEKQRHDLEVALMKAESERAIEVLKGTLAAERAKLAQMQREQQQRRAAEMTAPMGPVGDSGASNEAGVTVTQTELARRYRFDVKMPSRLTEPDRRDLMSRFAAGCHVRVDTIVQHAGDRSFTIYSNSCDAWTFKGLDNTVVNQFEEQ